MWFEGFGSQRAIDMIRLIAKRRYTFLKTIDRNKAWRKNRLKLIFREKSKL